MKILNLYCGIGGNRKKWEGVDITAVEKDEKIASVYSDNFPGDELIVCDAHEYLINNYSKFDMIWSSPPCQSHSIMNRATRHKKRRYADMKLYEEIIFLQNFYEGLYVVENVKPYYKPLIEGAQMGRHLFWSNFEFSFFDVKRPKGFINKCNIKGKNELMDWIGIHYKKNIYYENNHCPAQVLRNCVHPDLGLHILDAAKNVLRCD